MTDRQKIVKAFQRLRKLGWAARMNFWCCQTCGWYAIKNDYPGKENYIFFHNQDNDSFCGNGNLGRDLHIAWVGDIRTAIKILEEEGLTVVWDGQEHTRIKILPSELQAVKG